MRACVITNFVFVILTFGLVYAMQEPPTAAEGQVQNGANAERNGASDGGADGSTKRGSRQSGAVVQKAAAPHRKRPAAAGSHTVAKRGKPAAAAPKAVVHVGSRPPCPKVGDPPVQYKQGKIYVSQKRGSFRVICVASRYETEKSVKWSGKCPTHTEWAQALAKIDDYKP